MHYDLPIKQILVPTDFSEQAQNAFQFACDIAKKRNAEVTLLTVVDYPAGSAFNTLSINPDDPASNPFVQKVLEKVKKQIHEFPEAVDCEGVTISKKVQIGNPFTHISDEITQNDTDLVVMGTKGASGLDEVFIGSNTERVVRNAKCPVISVKNKIKEESVNDIVFAISFDNDNPEVIEKVKQLQDIFDAKLHIVSINTPNDFMREVNAKRALERVVEKYMIKDYTLNIFNDLTEEEGIIYFADEIDADMIALGTHGRKGIAHLISGSIAEDVVNHAKRPVWTYRIKK